MFSEEFYQTLCNKSTDELCREMWNGNIQEPHDSLRHLVACIASHTRAISLMEGIDNIGRAPSAVNELNDIAIDLMKILESLKEQPQMSKLLNERLFKDS